MRHLQRPLNIACTALAGICLATSLCFASPPKLYFEKDLQEQSNERYAYRIEKGDHVYDILRRFKISSELRPRLLQRTKEINPHIEDLDRIEPGQIVYFPHSVKKHAEFTVPKVPSFESPVPTTSYTVQRGEHLGQILRQKVGLSDSLIFDEYLKLFKELNPQIKDADRLDVGQRITIPLPPEHERGDIALFSRGKGDRGAPRKEKSLKAKAGGQTGNASSAGKGPGTSSSRAPESEPEPKPKPKRETKGNAKRRLALNMLRQMGFSPSAEEKILYPSQKGGWVHIDLDRTPILQTPWGRSLLLVPEQYATPLVRKKVKRTDLRSCRVKDSWALTDLFQGLQDTTKSRLIFWSPGESLILNFQQMVLEMRALYQFVIKTGEESRYHLFFRAPLAQERAAELLAGFLDQKAIHLYTIAKADGDQKLTRIEPSAEPPNQPDFSFANLWPRISDTLSSEGETPDPPGNRNPGTLLNFLRERNLAQKKTIPLEFLQEEVPSTSIVLTLRVTELGLDPPAVLLADKMADPNLCGLLGLKGYDGFSL
jgi:hypothetical protein